jgi:hypothetical protein
MKLLIITAIAAFDKDIKKMLKLADVKTFTYKEVIGFKDLSGEAIESNWFGNENNECESVLYYAFIKKEKVDPFFELVNEFNGEQESLSNIHIAVLNIEKSN